LEGKGKGEGGEGKGLRRGEREVKEGVGERK